MEPQCPSGCCTGKDPTAAGHPPTPYVDLKRERKKAVSISHLYYELLHGSFLKCQYVADSLLRKPVANILRKLHRTKTFLRTTGILIISIFDFPLPQRLSSRGCLIIPAASSLTWLSSNTPVYRMRLTISTPGVSLRSRISATLTTLDDLRIWAIIGVFNKVGHWHLRLVHSGTYRHDCYLYLQRPRKPARSRDSDLVWLVISMIYIVWRNVTKAGLPSCGSTMILLLRCSANEFSVRYAQVY